MDVPAETRGQSGSMDSTDVSRGSELDTQLQQFCKSRQAILGISQKLRPKINTGVVRKDNDHTKILKLIYIAVPIATGQYTTLTYAY